ncbi:glycosyltransferase family 4 protein [Clostridium sp. 'White wine YQ']|uniref:glycosyltransferase family 4 protein n=1 Tax=Clostridium sp. 'White wine YQ' TaxID=3027474 RepID=UPI00236631D9|nr:glycosyltransferase family 4 protein [Clostridium sp. 'White wine YQ']MDD7792754.1 glycosyltransferase family 4 protein [Clostridium sp. 'White wine YQ']
MRIIMFTDRFYPHIGGVEKHVEKLSEELIKMEHEVTIFTRRDSYKEFEVYKGIKIIRLKCDGKFSRIKIFLGILRNISKIIKADVIHCHDYSTFWYWFLPFRFILPFKKVFITFHGWEGIFPPERKVVKIRKKVEKLTSGNICVGDFITKWYDTKADKVIYGATDISDLSREEENKVNKSETSILYLGRLESDTGIIMYIEALKNLKKEFGADFSLDVCGTGTLSDSIKKMCDEYEIPTHFHGFVSDVEKYIINSDYVFTSGYLSILEAMSMKKIVICNYDNELKEDYLKMIPEYNKKIIIADNSEALANQLNEIIINKNKKDELIQNSYKWVKDMSWTNMAKEYMNLWTKL